GAGFDFGFGALAVGQRKSFRIFYGAASSMAGANAAVTAVGAELYSFGEPNPGSVPEGSARYSVAIFGFKGVGDKPLANAGPDQTVHSGKGVTLDGSASTDPNGDPLTFVWSEGGMTIATGPIASVDLALGVHDITLTVTDSTGLSDSDVVRVTVLNSPPTAADQSITTAEDTPVSFTLAASDPDGDALDYTFT